MFAPVGCDTRKIPLDVAFSQYLARPMVCSFVMRAGNIPCDAFMEKQALFCPIQLGS